MRKSRKMTSLLAAAVVFCSGIALQSAEASAAVSFTDIAGEYWAHEDIAFASEKGIVNGYEAAGGTFIFCPENAVSYEEAATMLYRALSAAGQLAGSTGSADAASSTSTVLTEKHASSMNTAGISEWARTYVAYGLEYGIIEQSELAHFVDQSTKLGNPVPRRTVAVWTAKALDKNFTGAYYLPFTDASQIDDETAPYVDVLYRHGIMQGSWQPDGSIAFLPDSGVKRSEFAAISNRVFKNSAAGYELAKETFNWAVPSGQTVPGQQIRFAEGVEVIGSQNGVIAVSGMSFAERETPQVHLVGAPEVLSGRITSVENLASGVICIGIETNNKNVYYIFDENTESTARIKEGEEIDFLADGIMLLEVK